jgi:hypothetical protein
VSDHHGRHACVDGGAERRKVPIGELRGRRRLHRELLVAVGGDRPVAREVLGHRQNPGRVVAAQGGRHDLRHQCGIRRRGPAADGRIVRSGRDVSVRREHHREAERAEFLATGLRDLGGEVGVAGGTEGHQAGKLRGRLTDPSHPAALLVHADDQRVRPLVGVLEGARHGRDLFRRLDVVTHQDDSAEMKPLDELDRCRRLVVARDDDLARLLLD